MGEQEGAVVLCSTKPPVKSAESSSKCCEECRTNAWKYKCPGCSVRSCSLPCVKAHKQRTGCTGKRRQHTEFVPLSQFDDNLLLSDYNMLEDVKRIADSAKRMRLQLCGKLLFGVPFHLRNLLKAAGSRRTKVLFLPSGMSKRETNRTYYNNRRKFISWTIEWRFHSTDVKLIDHGIHENSNLYSVIESHLKKPCSGSHPLKPFSLEPVESLKFFISKHPKRSRSPFREFDINAPLRQQLANLVIVEYPVIHVFLPSHSLDFEIVNDPIAHRVQPETGPVNEGQQSPKGVLFAEEEVKNDDSTEPLVLDLMNQSNGNSLHSTYNDNEPGVVNLMDFDFEPELIDVYSSLISETNPDDFLDLDGLLCDDMQLQEEKGERGVIKEELEEGEIADSD